MPVAPDPRVPARARTLKRGLVRSGITLAPQYFTGLDLFQSHLRNATVMVYPQGLDAEALEQSLAKVLAAYPVFAGRIKTDPQGLDFIDCNDAGVAWLVQQHLGPLPGYGIGRPVGSDIRRYAAMGWPWQRIDHTQAAFAVQIHQFEDGGALLSVTCAHSLSDGASFWQFMMDWVRVHHGHPINRPPELDRHAVIHFAQALSSGSPARSGRLLRVTTAMQRACFMSRMAWQYATRMAWTVFRVSGEQLTQWKHETRAAQDDLAPVLTSQDLVLAQCLPRLFGHLPPTWPRCISVVNDLRFRRGVGIDRKYVGNALGRDVIHLSADRIASSSLTDLARQCQLPLDHVSQAEVLEDLERLEHHRRQRSIHTLTSRAGWHCVQAGLVVNNAAHFPVYKIDFGHGPPSWHESERAPYRRLLLAPSAAQDGGLDVHLSAHRQEIANFRAGLPSR